MGNDFGHRFGGSWTERKLAAVRYYLDFYTTALSRQPFDLWYIDAFAGTGERTEEREFGGIFEQTPAHTDEIVLDGSAKRAMAVKPPFKHLLFMEPDLARYRALCALRDLDGRVECLQGDANALLPEVFGRAEWGLRGSGKGRQRGVVFLDPYGMQVSWETLEVLASTKRVDVWYLFPLNAVSRQLARDAGALDKHKIAALNRCLGGPSWREEFYRPNPNPSLFDAVAADQRSVSLDQIEESFKRRLESLFSWVSQPLPLFLDGGQQIFSLFLLVANDSPAAVQLAKSGMRDLLKKHEPRAYRRKGGL